MSLLPWAGSNRRPNRCSLSLFLGTDYALPLSYTASICTRPDLSEHVILLHTRPSCCLSVSALSITFACHAFCCNKSNIDAAAVSSRGTQSLFINVRLSAGLYDMLSVSAMGGTRTRVFAKVLTVIIMPYHSATIAFASAYLPRRAEAPNQMYSYKM